ncbi:hypothetical protein CJJ23_03800 [Mycoplasmopsis agassizii]|uniref:Lipoprotein-associated type-17 domain-containing protein n=1 Tax=Mycoplasmopsis agassizii TaxID=33922 RepID=A0A269TJ93_9BACT|nr:lipoprotein 17-related variable surface protein [Mycoplasmopsis agassizii]PAK21096.1 hypothetical protein CJJ23_03800 [Mycoplasmopsis agassizii]
MDKRFKRTLIGLGASLGAVAVVGAFAIGAVVIGNNNSPISAVASLEEVKNQIASSPDLKPTLNDGTKERARNGEITLTTVTIDDLVIDNKNTNLAYKVIAIAENNTTSINVTVSVSGVNQPTLEPRVYQTTVDLEGISFISIGQRTERDKIIAYIQAIQTAANNIHNVNFLEFDNFQASSSTEISLRTFFRNVPSIVSVHTIPNSSVTKTFEPKIDTTKIASLKSNPNFNDIVMKFEFLGFSNADDSTGFIQLNFRGSTEATSVAPAFSRDFSLNLTISTADQFIADQIVNKHFAALEANSRLDYPNIRINNDNIRSRDTALASAITRAQLITQSYPFEGTVKPSNANRLITVADLEGVRNPNGTVLTQEQRNAWLAKELNFTIGYVGEQLQTRLKGTIPSVVSGSNHEENIIFDRANWVNFDLDPVIQERFMKKIGRSEQYQNLIQENQLFVNQGQANPGEGQILVQMSVSLNAATTAAPNKKYQTSYFDYLTKLANNQTLINALKADTPSLTIKPVIAQPLNQLLTTDFVANGVSNPSESGFNGVIDTSKLLTYFNLPNQQITLRITSLWPSLRYSLTPKSASQATNDSGSLGANIKVFLNQADLDAYNSDATNDKSIYSYDTTLTGFTTTTANDIRTINELIGTIQGNRLRFYTDSNKTSQITNLSQVIPTAITDVNQIALPDALNTKGATVTIESITTPTQKQINDGQLRVVIKVVKGNETRTANIDTNGFRNQQTIRAEAIAQTEQIFASDANAVDFKFSTTATGDQKQSVLPSNATLSQFSLNANVQAQLDKLTATTENETPKVVTVEIVSITETFNVTGELNLQLRILYNKIEAKLINFRVSGFKTDAQNNLNEATALFKTDNTTLKASDVTVLNVSSLLERVTIAGTAFTAAQTNTNNIDAITVNATSITANDTNGTVSFTYTLSYNGLTQQSTKTVTVSGFITTNLEKINAATVVWKEGKGREETTEPKDIAFTPSVVQNWITSVTIDGQAITYDQNGGTNTTTYSLVLVRTSENANQGTKTIVYKIKWNNVESKEFTHVITGLKTLDQITANNAIVPTVTLNDASRTKNPTAVNAADFTISNGQASLEYTLMFNNVEGYTAEMAPTSQQGGKAVRLQIKIAIRSNPSAFVYKTIDVTGFTTEQESSLASLESAKSQIAALQGQINSSSTTWYNTTNAPRYTEFKSYTNQQILALLNISSITAATVTVTGQTNAGSDVAPNVTISLTLTSGTETATAQLNVTSFL